MGINLRHGQQVLEKEGSTFVSGVCTLTGSSYTTGAIPRPGLIDWLMGEPIQTAMPGVSIDDREFLISGASPDGWKTTFGKLED